MAGHRGKKGRKATSNRAGIIVEPSARSTRALYVHAEQVARHNERAAIVEQDAIARWRTWRAAERDYIVEHIRDMATEIETRDERARMATEAGNAADSARQAGQIARLQVLNQDARGAYRQLQQAQQAVDRVATAIHLFYQQHQASQALVEAANTIALEANNRLQRINRETADRDARMAERPDVTDVAEHRVRVHPSKDFQHDRLKAIVLKTDEQFNADLCDVSEIPTEQALKGWYGPFLIYDGTNGSLVTAWVGVDDHDTIVDCVVRKDVDTDRFWSLITFWDGDVRDVQNREPLERTVHRSMQGIQSSSLPDSTNILHMRHAGQNDYRHTHTIYTELAPYGSLDQLINAYSARAELIPEPFIWYVFLILVECGLAMQTGTVNGEAPADWQEVVHRDIKPHNVFLFEPEERFRCYPAPRLGDFGIALKTNSKDPGNPALYNDEAGTEGYRAPEQCQWRRNDTGKALEEYELGSHTNVTAVGMTIRAMMMADNKPKELWWFAKDAPDEPYERPRSEDGPRIQEYTAQLRRLVESCLRRDPDDRPSFRDLYTSITEMLVRDHKGIQALEEVSTLCSNTAAQPVVDRNTIYETEDTAGDDGTPVRMADRLRIRAEQLLHRGGDQRFALGTRFNGDHLRLKLNQMTHTSKPILKIGYSHSWDYGNAN